jgi:hypothetical protein
MSTADPSRPGGSTPRPPTGKQRASRIPLDYWKQRSPLDGARLWLTGLVVLLTLGGLAYALLALPNRGTSAVSRGPVASVHSFIDQQCYRCHVEFQPISQQSAGGAVDQRCQVCHQGPPHHLSQKLEMTPSCGGCHRDHRGLDASLVRLRDGDCTSCHRDLKAAMKPDAQPQGKTNITRFDKEHFQVPETDPGQIKFNHQLHLTKGLKSKWTLNSITDEKERDRYRNQQPSDLRDDSSEVQLDCASCHRLDGGDFGGKHSGAPAAGAYFQPITYENQCRACHELTFDPKKKGVSAPHGLQPAQLKDFVEGYFAREFYLKENPDVEKPPAAGTPLPGKKKPDPEELKRAQEAVRPNVEAALTRLLDRKDKRDLQDLSKQTCLECHSLEGEGKTVWEAKIKPADIPQVWQKKARFNHTSHRAMNCLDCHGPHGDRPGAEESTKHTDVLLPGADNCLQCHAPARMDNGQQVAGVRHDCTACHTYHLGNQPLLGIGAAARDPHDKLDVKKFLRGEK